ncbi:MAG: metal-dependent transcriptional regulator [Candidatus Dormibacteria bacterium]
MVGPGHPSRPERSETADRYLETIYYIEHEGEVPRPGRLAEWLGVSAPTVSVSLQRLVRDGWITVAPDRSVSLTPAGNDAAAGIVRRHRILERWLTDVLGLDWGRADQEAESMAHGLSELVLERLDGHLGRPDTCPHGNRIPGRGGPERRLVSLGAVELDLPAVVSRISEVAEHDAPLLLGSLHRDGVVPGARVIVRGRDQEWVRLRVGEDREVSLAPATAAAVWVEDPCPPFPGVVL